MNKTIVTISIVILVLVGGGFYIANQQSKQTEEAKMAQEKAAMEEKASIQAKEDSTKKEEDKMMADRNSSRYVEYSKQVLDQAAGNSRVLYFYASWCPTCRPANADFEKNASKIPQDMVVVRVNYNDPETDKEEKELAKKYSITYQHTFVQIDSQGKEITRWNGGQTDELLANIK